MFRSRFPYNVALTLALTLTTLACRYSPPEGTGYATWWKGNLHTHSFWSDGDQFPEMIIDWYASRDYNFLAISDHNTFQAGTRWRAFDRAVGEDPRIQAYRDRFGDDWVEEIDSAGSDWVRLKTLAEYRDLFDDPGRFLLMQAEEITDRFETRPVHINATNLEHLIEPQGGTSVLDVLQRDVDAVLAQRDSTGTPMIPHVNHPNFGWAIAPSDLVHLQGERFFEVYNGHPAVHNEGDSTHLSTEVLWDVVLAERLSRGSDVLYGIATDDAHNFLDEDPSLSNPGRGWIMVNAGELSAGSLIDAMEAGHFYASSGVSMSRVSFDGETLSVGVDAVSGEVYTIQFIGSPSDYLPTGEYGETLDLHTATRLAGETLAEFTDTEASYRLTDAEMYVRAVVTSSKRKSNPYEPGEYERAWIQPVIAGSRPFSLD